MKMRTKPAQNGKPRRGGLSAKLSLGGDDGVEVKQGRPLRGVIQSPSEMDAHRRREMAKIMPTEELTKSELIALVLAARCPDIGEEVKQTVAELQRAKAGVAEALEKPTNEEDAAAVAALRAENVALKKQLKGVQKVCRGAYSYTHVQN